MTERVPTLTPRRIDPFPTYSQKELCDLVTGGDPWQSLGTLPVSAVLSCTTNEIVK